MHCFISMKNCLISLLQVVTPDEIYRPLESFLVSSQLKVEIKCQEQDDELVVKILMALTACGVSREQISIIYDYNTPGSKLFIYSSLPFYVLVYCLTFYSVKLMLITFCAHLIKATKFRNIFLNLI